MQLECTNCEIEFELIVDEEVALNPDFCPFCGDQLEGESFFEDDEDDEDDFFEELDDLDEDDEEDEDEEED